MFCKEYDEAAKAFSIEDDKLIHIVKSEEMLVFAYPVQYSTAPKIAIAEFDEDMKICDLKEFQSKVEHYYPYGE